MVQLVTKVNDEFQAMAEEIYPGNRDYSDDSPAPKYYIGAMDVFVCAIFIYGFIFIYGLAIYSLYIIYILKSKSIVKTGIKVNMHKTYLYNV